MSSSRTSTSERENGSEASSASASTTSASKTTASSSRKTASVSSSSSSSVSKIQFSAPTTTSSVSSLLAIPKKGGLNFGFKSSSNKHTKPAIKLSTEFQERKKVVASKEAIPLIKDNIWYNRQKKRSSKDDVSENGSSKKPKTEDSLDAAAANSLVEKSRILKAKVKKEDSFMVDEGDAIPLLVKNAVPGLSDLRNEDEKFRHDVVHRPDAPSLEVYDQQPIESFGKRMLAGMGWKEGSGIGRTNVGIAKPHEARVRARNLGLGAREIIMPTGPKLRKDGTKWIRKPGEEKVKSKNVIRDSKLQVNALVQVLSGEFKGKFGVITYVVTSRDVCSVLLRKKIDTVQIPNDELKVLDETSLSRNHPALEMLKPKKRDRSVSPKKTSSSSRISSKNSKKSKKSKKSKDKKPKKQPKRIKWVVPNIRIRIISKKLEKGKYYKKKGYVEDVSSPFEFMVVMDDKSTLTGVTEKEVETVVPSEGGHVLIVSGEHKGQRGILYEKNWKKNRADVQLAESLEIVKCTLDDIAECIR